jgi:hypothetical protein
VPHTSRADNVDLVAVPVLTASEIAEFVFCRQAWHLSRQGAPRDTDGNQRLLTGSASHRFIGRTTDHIGTLTRVRRLLVLVLIVILTSMVGYIVATSAFIRP